ncbi:MAG TPA: GspMb/PilO family protein [Pyrinomonadaceae bacterium]|nr:GspMb/PilO family protein [Pyrinomonadaceae bacterium]
MSAELKTEPRLASRGYNARFSEFLQSRRGKMFGVAEVAAVAGSCFVLALVLLSYLYFVVPARSRVASLNADRNQLQTNLQTLDTVVNKEQNTKDQVDRVAASLEKFESGHLLRPDEGRMDLYEELNQLIVKNGVRNTSGPTYTPLDPTGMKSASGKTVTTKWQSFYPGISVMMTVEGQYQDVRRFIRDVERSKQFVVINEVELQRANENSAPVATEEGGGSGTRGSLVSLQLNMTTYFQRDNGANTPAAGQGQ